MTDTSLSNVAMENAIMVNVVTDIATLNLTCVGFNNVVNIKLALKENAKIYPDRTQAAAVMTMMTHAQQAVVSSVVKENANHVAIFLFSDVRLNLNVSESDHAFDQDGCVKGADASSGPPLGVHAMTTEGVLDS